MSDPNFPDRPDHPDFKALSLAVIQQIYMAKQRALRLIRATPPPSTEEDLVAALASTWVDGFIAGLKVGDGRTMIENEQLLDDSINNGNRRQSEVMSERKNG